MRLKFKIDKSPTLKGIRGLFATEKIYKDELIELSPVVLIPNSEIEDISKTVVTRYEFNWDEANEALVLGYGSLYNHSFIPNVEFNQDHENKVMEFTALRDIDPGEELLINYNQGSDDPSELEPEYTDSLF